MIQSKDRSRYFGGSDAKWVTGKWSSDSFKNWWLVKIGIFKDDLETKAMKVGNAYEHKILDFYVPECEKDGQIILEDIKLRVNYDGVKGNHIYEVKTYSADEFKVSKAYREQAQVEMFAWNEAHWGEESKLSFLAYKVEKQAEYLDYFLPIDPDKLTEIEVEYDEDYIEEWLLNAEHLCKCLEEGTMPNENDRPNRDKPKGKKKSTGKR